MEHWPFAQPPDEAAITLRQILDGKKPILLVARDPEDGSWSFLTGEDFRAGDGKVVSLRTALSLDPTLAEVADLPIGWYAYRQQVGAAWERAPEEE